MDDLEGRIEACEQMLLCTCREEGILLSGDRRVKESDAARLLGYSPDGLRHLRESGTGPYAHRAPVAGSRWSYRLHDLAVWIERRRDG